MHRFTAHLKSVRKKWKFSQREIAFMCGFKQPFYARLENHRIKNPCLDTFKKLGKAIHENPVALVVMYMSITGTFVEDSRYFERFS